MVKAPALGVLAMERFKVFILLVLAVAMIYGLSRLSERFSPYQQSNYEETSATKERQPEQRVGSESIILGSPEAKVKVVAVVPLSVECHSATVQVLREIAKAEPKRVRVEVYDMGSPQGQEFLARHNAHCASVFVNGQCDFTIKVDGKEKEIHCQRQPNTPMSPYNSTDLIEVVHQELQRLNGQGFDEKTLRRLRAKGREIVWGISGEETVSMDVPPGKKPKVIVEVLMPSQSLMVNPQVYQLFSETINTLRTIKKRYPDTLAVRILPLITREGQRRLQDLGLPGPAVVINGKVVHELFAPGKGKQAVITVFSHETSFTPSEVEQVVLAYLK